MEKNIKRKKKKTSMLEILIHFIGFEIDWHSVSALVLMKFILVLNTTHTKEKPLMIS